MLKKCKQEQIFIINIKKLYFNGLYEEYTFEACLTLLYFLQGVSALITKERYAVLLYKSSA